MEYRKLGRTHLKVSVIGVGGGAFSGKDKKLEKVKKVITLCIKNGINFIDTAEDYDERKVGVSIKEFRDRLIISTKSFSSNEKDMTKSIKNSLKNLQTDYIDIYMMQTVDTVESLNFRIKNGVLNALKKAKKEGTIGWIGISGHRIQTMIEAIKINEFDVIEIPYTVAAYETEKIFEIAKDYDVGIIAMRPFGGGILVDRSNKNKLMCSKNILSYVLSNKNIATVIVGMSLPQHAIENIKNSKYSKISKKERMNIEKKVIKFLGKNFCRGCLACMPCDIHGWKLPIDQMMKVYVYYFKYGIKNSLEEYKTFIPLIKKCFSCKKLCEKRCPYKVPIVYNLRKLKEISS
jgi:predicted aldo/keto reductase-like oxidoreductase